MYLLPMISDFLLATWFFSITYDWFHIMINTCMLAVLFYALLHIRISRAIMLSFSAHFFAFVVYTAIAISLLLNYVMTHHMPSDVSETSKFNDILYGCLHLACIYAILQSIFLLLMHVRSEFSLRRIVEVVWLSNMVSALLSYVSIITFLRPLL